MKTTTYGFFVALFASLMLASCFDDKETTYSDYCYIRNFTLSSVKQAHHLTGSQGQDSVYYTSFSGTNFIMSVNQHTLEIENHDSLPYLSAVDKLVTSCTFESVLAHRFKDITGLEPADTAWVTFDSSDSIDFSRPRSFMVFSADGSSKREYTIKVNAHQMEPDLTVWDSLGTSTTVFPENVGVRKMFALDGQLIVIAKLQDGTLTCFTRDAKKQAEWKQQSMSGETEIELETMQQANGMLFASTTSGHVLYSIDGKEWRSRLTGMAGLRLVGVSEHAFYALVDGKLMVTTTAAENWVEEVLDDDVTLLPARDIVMQKMTQTNGIHRLLIAGKTADGGAARLWAKSWSGTDAEMSAGWVYYGDNQAIKNPFPVLNHSNLLPYDGTMILFGGAPEGVSVQASNVVEEPLGRIYVSNDYGITWMKHEVMEFTDGQIESAAQASSIIAALQDDCYIWILLDGQLWRGRLNSVLFKTAKK